jgi:parallel beta-helix repeat protein
MLSFLATLVSVPDNVLATNHGGWITSDETWDKNGNPHYIVRDVRVMPSVTLIITEGVNVSFNLGTSLYVDGDLAVLGTESEPVTFTSNAFIPQAGDWGSVHFNASTGGQPPTSQISQAIIEYGSSAIYVNNRSLAIYNSIIRYSLLGIDSYYAALTVDTNTINDNINDGINWTGSSFSLYTSSVVFSNITNNGGNGINGSAGAKLSITNNSITFNKFGIHFVDSTPKILHSSIKNNSEDGIYFLRSGNDTIISHNTIANNSKNGIWVNTSTVQFHNNTIDNNGQNGTYLVNYDGKFENNTVQSNSGNGIESDDSSIYVYNNTISSNSRKGLHARECVCQISHNMIASNSQDGVRLQYSSNSALYHNNLTYNPTGFQLLNSANTIISKNELWSTVSTFGLVLDSSNITISNNTGFGGGIRVVYSDNVSAWTNWIESPPFWGIDFRQSSNISLGNNVILRSSGGDGGIGIFLSENAPAINNTVLHRAGIALNVHVSENVVLQKNNITSTGEFSTAGIHIGSSTNVNVTDGNTVSNHDIGIWVSPYNQDIVIYDNTTISDNDIGILCTDSSPIILNNTIEDNEIGIQTESGSTPQIRGNNIEGNTDYGVENTDTVWVDAKQNWWGDATGPGDWGPGNGDDVTNYVNYLLWHTQPSF